MVRARHLLPGALVATLIAAAPASADTDRWPERRVMNMSHQGGEFEAPSNTIYALRRSVRRGTDMLELDVHPTADGRLVVIHDATVDRTTEGSGLVGDMTLGQVQRLDAAHNFVPSRNAVRGLPQKSYPWRGVRTGERRPPSGYSRHDFRIPTLAEVFRRFPKTPINIEIKGDADTNQASFDRNADILAEFLNNRPERAGDVIVVSFNQAAVDRFHAQAPEFGVAPGIVGVTGFYATRLVVPDGTVALQVPTALEGVPVATRDFVRSAHARGLAVHVFLDAQTEENDATYRELLSRCVDGLMTAYPTRLERYLVENRVERPGRGGTDPCA